MTRIILLTTLLALTLDHAHCQDPAKAPAFEVAAITPCKPGTPEPPGEHAGMVQFTYPGGRFKANGTTVKFLIEWAYGIQPSQHSDGPAWLATDRYDVTAKAEGSATDSQMKLMMQTLLADRFQLKLRREKKQIPVYVISVGKTAPKILPSKDGEEHTMGFTPKTGPDQKVVSYHVVATRFSIGQVADIFSRQLGRVMVDMTGLKGDFNFTMDLTPDDARPSPMDPALLMAALREQIGLTLKAENAPVDYLTIESAQKVAAGN